MLLHLINFSFVISMNNLSQTDLVQKELAPRKISVNSKSGAKKTEVIGGLIRFLLFDMYIIRI